ncbi:MAG: hypothetical protein ACE5HJ_08320 [Thermoplasmata archaeon]
MGLKKGFLAMGFVLQGLGIYWVVTAATGLMRIPRYWLGAYPDIVSPGVDPELMMAVTANLVWALLSLILAAAVFALVHCTNRPRRLATSR